MSRLSAVQIGLSVQDSSCLNMASTVNGAQLVFGSGLGISRTLVAVLRAVLNGAQLVFWSGCDAQGYLVALLSALTCLAKLAKPRFSCQLGHDLIE